MRSSFRALLLAPALACALAACGGGAPEKPESDEVREHLSTQLPGYWKVERMELAGGRRTGGDTLPVYRARFTAEIQLTEQTFVEAQRVGSAVVVRRAGTPGDRKTVYGTVESSWKDGAWESRITVENDPAATFGQPMDLIHAPRVVEAGTEEERALWAEAASRGAPAPLTGEAAAERARVAARLAGEWFGSVFDDPGARLVVEHGDGGVGARLYFKSYVETLRLELLAGGRILFVGTRVTNTDGGTVSDYSLDTLELELSPDGTKLTGTANDEANTTGEVKLRRVIS